MMDENIDDKQRPIVGLTITKKRAEMAFPESSREDSYSRHVSEIATVIDTLVERLGVTVVFLPHCIGYGADLDDRNVARDIYLECVHQDHVILIEKEYTAGELKGLLGQMDLFIGERIHSVVNAMSMHIPSIALSDPDDTRLDMFKPIQQGDRVISIES